MQRCIETINYKDNLDIFIIIATRVSQEAGTFEGCCCDSGKGKSLKSITPSKRLADHDLGSSNDACFQFARRVDYVNVLLDHLAPGPPTPPPSLARHVMMMMTT